MNSFIIFMICALIYFLPGIIATSRHHKNSTGVFILNLFLGWTFLGWVVALVWSVAAKEETKKD